MMSSNLTDRLKGLGVESVNRLQRAYDINGSLGGPILKDRLWFFFTGHRKTVDRVVLGSFYPDGSPGIDDTLIHAHAAAPDLADEPSHKLAAFYDDNNKVEYHTHTAGEDILTASQTRGVGRPRGPRYAAQVKWTATIGSRFLAEAGWGTNRVDYVNKGQEGLRKDRPASVRTCVATPCLSFDPGQVGANIDPWYTTMSNFDPEAPLERWGNVTDDFHKVPQRYFASAKMTYVTGTAQLQGRRPEQFRPGELDPHQQRRHPERRVPRRGAGIGRGLEHAGHLERPGEPRSRRVRPGFVEVRRGWRSARACASSGSIRRSTSRPPPPAASSARANSPSSRSRRRGSMSRRGSAWSTTSSATRRPRSSTTSASMSTT